MSSYEIKDMEWQIRYKVARTTFGWDDLIEHIIGYITVTKLPKQIIITVDIYDR